MILKTAKRLGERFIAGHQEVAEAYPPDRIVRRFRMR